MYITTFILTLEIIKVNIVEKCVALILKMSFMCVRCELNSITLTDDCFPSHVVRILYEDLPL